MRRILVLTCLLLSVASLHAGGFTAGNLVISRVGDGSTTLNSTAAQVSLVEVQTTGTATGTVLFMPVPAANNGGGLTDSGSASTDGHLNRSVDGRYLVIAGFDAPLGATAVASSASTTVNRTVARVDGAGATSIVARLNDAFTGNNIRSACSDTGASYYVGGGSAVRWADASSGTPTTSTAILATGSQRDVIIAQDATGAKFLVTNTSGTSLSTFGSPPTTATTSLGVTLTDSNAFVLLDRSATVGATGLGGLDTLYVADGTGSGTAVLRKFEWNGTAWATAGTATLGTANSKLCGLTARVAANGSVELYATTFVSSNNSLVTITDSSNSNAFGGSLSGTLTVLGTAGANYAYRGVAFAPQPDLTVSVAAPSNTLAGVNYDYTLTASNAGASNASGVGVQFTLPAGLNYVGATGAGFTISQSGGVVTFSGGSISGNGSATLKVTVNAATAATYTAAAGAAVIDGANTIAETNETNNISSAAASTVVAVSPDLTVSVTVPAGGIPNTSFDYTLTAANSGTGDAANVTVQFTIPSGLSFVSAAGTSFTVSQNSGVVSFTGGAIPSGTSATLTVTVTAASEGAFTAPVGAAVIDPANTIAEASETNNASPVAASIVVANKADLSVAIAAPATALVGAPFTYTLTVNNFAALDATGVKVTFTLPSGLNFDSASGTGFSVAQSAGVVTFTGGSITAGSTATLTVTVDTSSAGPVSVSAGAVVADPDDTIVESNETNNSSMGTPTTTVLNRSDLSIAVSAPATAYVGLPFDYTLTASNTGLGNASGVTAQFTLPAGLTFVSATGFASQSQSSGVVTFSGGTLNASTSATLTVRVTAASAAVIAAGAGAAVIDPTNAILESDETNNSSAAAVNATNVLQPPDLTVGVTAPATASVGTAFDYTVTVSNTGLGDASGVAAQFTIPPGLTFVAASGFTGSSQSGGVVNFTGGTLAAGASATLHVTVSTLTNGSYIAPAGAAVVDAGNTIVESNENNNSSTGAATTSVQSIALTRGNLAVYRVGSGTGSLASTGSAVFVDEFTPAGVLVQSVAMPTAASGTQWPLVASGTATSEGFLSRSADNRYVMLTGYGTTPGGSSSVSSTTATSVPRVVARLSCDGSVDTTTALTDFASGNNFRGVASSDGTKLWVSGNFNGASFTSTGGVHFATLGGSSSTDLTSTADSGTFTSARAVGVFDGQLYASGTSTPLKGVGTIGAGLPVSGAQAVARLAGLTDTSSTSTNAFFLADLSPSIPGVDTLYIADDNATTGGIKKFSLVAGVWTDNGTAGLASQAYRGLTASVSGGVVTLYATRNGTDLVSLVDNTGYNAPIATTAPTVLATASANTAYRGVAFGPVCLPELGVAISAPTTAAGGAEFTYTITATNTGDADASNVTVRFPLPAGTSFVSASGIGFTPNATSTAVNFTSGTLAMGVPVVLSVTVTATDGSYNASAVVDPDGLIVEKDETNNTSATVNTVVTTPDLTVTAIHNGDFIAGDSGTYVLTVKNIGTRATSGDVTVTATLPTGLTATAFTGGGWSVTQATGSTVTATRSDALGVGLTYTGLTLTVDIDTTAPSSLTAAATVAGGGELNAANDSAQDVTPIEGVGPGTIQFGAANYSVFEEAGTLTLPIQRSGGRAGSVSVTVNTSNGSATAPADYGAITNQVVTFGNRDVLENVVINITHDNVRELNETFTVTLSDPQNGAALGANQTAQVLIVEADTTNPVLTLIAPTPAANATVNEGSVVVRANANDNSGGKLTVDPLGISTITVSLNSGPSLPLTSVSATPPYYQLALAPHPGLNAFTVRATDFRGNASEVTRSFTYVVKRPLALNVLPVPAAGTVAIAPKDPASALQLGKSYTLTATPAAGYVWDHWTTPGGDVEAPTLTFTMTEGLAITANFVHNPFEAGSVGAFNGLIIAAGATTAGNGTNGFINVAVSNTGGFTGSIKIDGLSLPVAGVLDNTGVARFGTSRARTLVLSRTNKPGLVLGFRCDLAPLGTHKLTGTLDVQTPSGSTPMSVIDADRAAFDGKTGPTTTIAATYTIALPATSTNLDYPQGDGIGNLTVGQNGAVAMTATLADGTVVTASAPLSQARTVPLFAQLYVNKGGCFGAQVALDETKVNTDLSSTSSFWFRPFVSGQYYPHGWPEGIAPTLIGAKYVVPVGESLLRGLDTVPNPNASLTFNRGALASGLTKSLVISKTNAITKVPATDASFKIALTPATGRLAGTFLHSNGTQPAYAAVVLQKGANRRAFGYFLTTAPKVADGTGLSGSAHLDYVVLPTPTLVISEFMAKNVTSITDEDGAHSDWIEIYNPSATDVSLLGWCLTDDATNLMKWRFPDVTLGSKQFLIVWASGKNRTVPGSPLHTNFSLSNSGEYLALVHPDGVTIEMEFAPTFPALADDESYGLNFDSATLLSKGAAVRYLVPKDAKLGNTWTGKTFNDSAWKAGTTGLGFGLTVPGLTVRQVQAAGSYGGVNSIATATALLALPKGNASIASESTAIVAQVNLLGDGSDGHYDNNITLPNGTPEPYALRATGFITIPTTGSYVFGLNSDDGGQIKIDGTAVMVDDSNHGPEDHLSAPQTLTAGLHAVEVMMWEGGGGDEVEFYAAAGTKTAWDDSFKLAGGPGGLALSTLPLNSGSSASPDVGTNVQTAMQNINATCYVRLPFTASEVSTLSGLTLKMRYNDGFIAYLNGVEVARRNAPATATFDSTAAAARDVSDAQTIESIDLTAQLSLLVNGSNVLAIQGLNNAASDSSFLVLPELYGSSILRPSIAAKYSPEVGGLTATPGAVNGVPNTPLVVADTDFSVHRGFFTAPFTTAISCATPGVQIRYTTDGSTPTATHGTVYATPLKISRTTVLRAAAFKTGYTPTDVDTQSYFFLDDVILQQPTGTSPGPGWEPPAQVSSDAVNGQLINYGMDPRIVNTTDSTIGGTAKVKEALAALPTISMVMDLSSLFDATTGLYVHPYNRSFDWERPCSIEFIGDSTNPDGGFHINGGVRTRGGYSRSPDNPKHSFHLYFRSQYGKSKLSYPLFGSSGTSSFDQIDMRTSQNYSWSFGGDGSNTFVREETSRELQLAMGDPGSRDRYFHLYINGVYWGLYDFDERTEASFGATYLGGDKTNMDVVKCEQDSGYVTGVTDGNLDTWQQLWNKSLAFPSAPTNANYFALQGKAEDGVTPTADPVLLDMDNMIDYMMLTFWSGNLDGCTSAFLSNTASNNWFAIRDRTGHRGFTFYVHDFEHTFFNVDEDRTGPFDVGDRSKDFTYSNPMWIHQNLRLNAEYCMRWADRVQKHMFNNGTLVGSTIIPRIQRRVTTLDTAIIAESARWGDSKRAADQAPLTRQDWLNATNYLVNTYLPNRGSVVLQQLRNDGLYPSFDAPDLSQFGGKIASGTEVTISGHGGTVYYTLDGGDPRLIGGSVNANAQVYTSASSTETLLPLNQTWKYLGDGSDQGTAWRAPGFDDSTWASGPAELGYGDFDSNGIGDEATVVPYIDADPVTPGLQKNATTYFRSTFTASNVSQVTSASISLKYDDAAIIYINGVEAVRTGNIASNPAYNQYSSGATPNENAFFDFTVDPSLLVNGTNSIAVEIHQANPDSSDISFNMSLTAKRTATATPVILNTIGSHRLQVRALNNSEWSALVDATFDVRNLPDLRIANVANGSFSTGDTGKTFTLTVSNSGNGPTTGLVTVTDDLPASIIVTGVSGTGWSIVQGAGSHITATRADVLAASGSYPPLTLTVNVAAYAPDSVVTTAAASGGGEINTGNSTAITSTPVTPSGAGTIAFDAARYDVNEEAGSVTVTVVRSGIRAGAATVVLNSINGTAKAPGDFGAQTNVTIDFADGDAVKTVTIPIVIDTVSEPNETFTLKLSNATGTATLGSQSTTTVRIIEADTVRPAVAISTPAVNAKVIAANTTITGSATDNKGVARVQIAVNGGAYFDVPTVIAANGLSATYSAPIGAVSGLNTITARSVDTRGNISSVATRSFTFVPLRPLTLTVQPLLSGTVAITPKTDLSKLQIGTSYTLKATPAATFLFDHWITPSGNVTTPTLTFTMSEGLAITASFVPNKFVSAITGDFNGLLRSAGALTASNANNGFINLKPGATGAFTGKLKLDGDALSLIGQFQNNGTVSLAVPRKNKPSLLLALTLDLDVSGTHKITGSVTELDRDSTVLLAMIDADRAFFDGRTQVATKANYKVKVPALPVSATLPTGEGTGTVSVATSGVATLGMKLADGTSFTATAPMSQAMNAPLYSVLYSTGQGSFLARSSLPTLLPSGTVICSDALWFRPYLSGTSLPFGFAQNASLQVVP